MTEGAAELYGRSKVLRFVTDGLDRTRHRATPPVMLLIGPRGTGKTMLLDRLETVHRTGSPTARLDFSRAPDASPAAVMLDIGASLSPGVARVGKVRLPLLGVGLIALSLDPESEASPAEQLNQRLTAQARTAGRVLGEVAKQAGTLLPGQEPQAVAAEVATVLGWLAEGISRRRLGDYLGWYASVVGRGNGTRFGPLLQLHDWWKDPDTHADVWLALCSALLADLRDGFNRFSLSHGQRTTNCLLLLDNVDTGAGVEFLETLAECRRKVPAETDPLLVVATQRTLPALRPEVGPPVKATDEGLSYRSWLEETRDREEQPSPWYSVLLTDLSTDNAQYIVASHFFGRAWRDVDFVHDVSGGHPVALRQLAWQFWRARPAFDPRDVLALAPSPDDDGTRAGPHRVEGYLLSKLKPQWLDDRQLDEMSVFAATLRPRLRPCASVFKFLEWRNANEMDVRELFLNLMWAEEADDVLVVRPLPALLLTCRLARNDDLWEGTHEAFLTHYRTAKARDEIAEQYHMLAQITSLHSGNLGKVAAYLDERLSNERSREWNASVAAITAAPNRFRLADDERTAAGQRREFGGDQEDVVKRLADLTTPGDRLRTVTRLIAARWLYNDRLFDPAHRLALLLAREYYELAQLADGDSEVFYQEARYFRKVAREWEDRS